MGQPGHLNNPPVSTGGGGPSGTWTAQAPTATAIAAGATVTLGQLPTPTVGTVAIAFVGMDGGAGNHLAEGSTLAAINANTIAWNYVISGSDTLIVAKAGASVVSCNLTLIFYTLTP